VPADIVGSKRPGMAFAPNPEAGAHAPVIPKTREAGPAFTVGLRPYHTLHGVEDRFAAFWSAAGDLIFCDLRTIRPIYPNSGFQPAAQVSIKWRGGGFAGPRGRTNRS